MATRQYIGEFECKADDKGRVVIPAGLKKQIPKEAAGKMVINRGFDKCLTLFTKEDWKTESSQLTKLNYFNRKDRRFIRLFNNGATEIQVDAASRILLPKKLSAYAEIGSEVVFYAYDNRIEIWSKANYDEMMDIDPDDFSELAEDVMDDQPKDDNE